MGRLNMKIANGTAAAGKLEYGSRLLTQVVDRLAETEPDRLYAIYPRDRDINNGFHKITFWTLSRAVNHFARTLDALIGRSETFETIAYQGPSDIRYIIIWLGAIKCGYKLLVTSPRNAAWMNVSLLQSTECTKFFAAAQALDSVRRLQGDIPELEVFNVQSLDDMLGSDNHQGYDSYDAKYADVKFDPILILHSSGSTGPPKPVVTNHASWAVADRDRDVQEVPGRQNQNWSLFDFSPDPHRTPDSAFFTAFPPFHLGGISCLILPIYSTNATLVLAHPDTLPTGHIVCEMMKHLSLRAIFAPPSILEQLSQQSEGIQLAGTLDFVIYAGGPLTQHTGEALSQVTKVCQFFGSTETNGIQALVPQRDDWAYFEFHPSAGIEMQPSEDEAYELVLIRGSERRESRAFSCNFPAIHEYRTRDLFRPHPIKKGLWKFHGRQDDIIVLSNGEKFNPVPSEGIIASHPMVNAALIVGVGRFQPALLVEPKRDPESDTHAITKDIWPTVEQANAQAPGQGRIMRSMIVITPPSRPFERAGKGTVIRRMTAEKFEDAISALYPNLNHLNDSASEGLSNEKLTGGRLKKNMGTSTKSFHLSDIRDLVSSQIRRFLQREILDDDDFYVLGLDSLRTIEIVHAVKQALPLLDAHWLQPQSIYSHPTINHLSEHLYYRLQTGLGDVNTNNCNESTKSQDSNDELAAMLSKHTSDLKPDLHVLLTGATGSLGKQILYQLLASPSISRVSCFTRSADAIAKQKLTQVASICNWTSAVEVITADYVSPRLGLDREKYHNICKSVDVIIHNAWPVNFTWQLRSFEPQISGIQNLIKMSRASSKHARIIFISSASSVSSPSSTPTLDDPIPESVITDPTAPAPMGYSQSKLVGENLLDSANTQLGIPTTILRVGQIAGSCSNQAGLRTVWKKDEWVYALLRSCKTLQALPVDMPDVDWLPIDTVAAVIKDVTLTPCLSKTTEETRVLNIVSPRPVRWVNMIPIFLQRLGDGVRLVTLEKWIGLLSQSAQRHQASASVEVNLPALLLMDFFRTMQRYVHPYLSHIRQDTITSIGLTRSLGFSDPARAIGGRKYATERAQAASAHMRAAKGVQEEWLERWLEDWEL